MVINQDFLVSSAFSKPTQIFKKKIYDHSVNNEWIADPYVGFKLKKLEKKIENELILKSNSLGLRADEINKNDYYHTLFLGGSLVFGSYAPNQNSTISEFYSNLMNHRMLNGGVGGHVLKQHLSLYYNYLSKVSVKKIILVFGFNDMTNCYQGKTFNDIRLDIFHKNVDLIYKQPTKELLKIILFKTMDFFKLKKLIFNLKNKTENKMVKYSVFKIEKYCNEVDQALTTFNQFCKNKSIDLCIILQPSLTSSFKKKSLYEENYIKKNLTEERINFSRVFFKNLNSTLKKYENYYNFQNIYDEEEKTIFIDSAHVGDIGNKIFAEKLFYKLNQKKYM